MSALTPEQRYAGAAAQPPPAPPQRMPRAGARRLGDLLITSGRTAVGPDGTLLARGRLGGEVDLETGRRCAWQCAANVVAAARAELGSLDLISRVTRVTVFVASAPGFVGQSLVADGATQYFHTVFGPEAGHHARSAIGVMHLPNNSPVEVEAIFDLGRPPD